MSFDPFDRWAALQNGSTDASNRLDEAVDLAFWERVATDYDPGALAHRVPAVLERNGTGWIWPRNGRIAVIWWDAAAYPRTPGR